MTHSIQATAPGKGGVAITQKNNATAHNKAAKSAKTQNDSITLVRTKTESRVDTRLIADHLGVQHKATLTLVDRYIDHFHRFGQLPFKKVVGKRMQGGGNPLVYALLNEDQVYFLLSLSRNNGCVVDLKARLVLAFREARQALDVHQTEYLPGYHELHDEIARLADGSDKKRFVHMNINKALNRVVGVRSGERHSLPMPAKSLMIVAQSVVRNAMASAHDHKDAYQSAKVALQALSQALEVSHVKHVH